MKILFITYNRLDFSKQALFALLKNTRNPEIFIIDNYSTDGTREWLKTLDDPRIDIWLLSENSGVAGAMNEFLELTKDEEFIAKVDNDTIVPRNWLRDLLRELKRHKLDIIQARHEIMNGRFKTWDEWMEKLKKEGNIYYSSFVGGSPIVMRRSVFKDKIDEKGGVWGFTRYQFQHCGLKKAFCGSVRAHLLDMIDDNHPDYSQHLQYYFSTKRLRQ